MTEFTSESGYTPKRGDIVVVVALGYKFVIAFKEFKEDELHALACVNYYGYLPDKEYDADNECNVCDIEEIEDIYPADKEEVRTLRTGLMREEYYPRISRLQVLEEIIGREL